MSAGAGGGDEGGARITRVTGGAEGLEATYAQVLDLAAAYDTAGNLMRAWAATGRRTLTDGDLLESAVLSPVTFAAAQSTVLAASTGPDGVLVESLGWEADAVLIRVTVRALQETDDLVHATFEVLDYLTGRALGFGLVLGVGGLLGAGLLVGPMALTLWRRLPPPVRQQVRDGSTEALEDWLVEHPEAVQHLVNGGGGLLDGLWDGLTPLTPGGPCGVPTLTPDTESAAGLLAALYGPDAGVRVSATGLDVPGDARRPHSLADVIGHLGAVAGLSPTPDSVANGTIEVQSFTGEDGAVRHVVYLPGTDDLTTLPWTQDGDVRDMATNFQLVNGADNAYQDGILQAMREAGIGPGDPVLLVGHSMGGMEAAAILGQGGQGGQGAPGRDFNVTHVVTAGSPTAHVDGGFPPGTHVLSLEHEGDVVPLLDGEDNPDTVEQVTVRFGGAAAESGVVGHHDYPAYLQGAEAVDTSTDPSIRAGLQSLVDGGFLAERPGPGPQVRSQVFQITRLDR